MALTNLKTPFYSRQGLWSLFLVCAFPLHLWTLLLGFRDLSWLIERTNLWDAISVVSYGLIFAFAESAIIFFIAVLLGFLVPRYWNEQQRIGLMSILVLITALWAMENQMSFIYEVSLPVPLLYFFARQAHPVRAIYAVALLLVIPTVLLPTYFVLRSEKTLRFVNDLIERLTLLSTFYLVFDVIGLAIVLYRNL